MGGKENLLKAIIQSIPVFAMAVFKIPKKVCKEITDAVSAFWWGIVKSRKVCTGLHGGGCAFQKIKETWNSETYTLSILLCLQSRVGGY